MLQSLALIFLAGIALGEIFEKLRLPKLLGMLLAGILLGPHMLNLLDPVILEMSADLRLIALLIILTRAGLNLNITDLKKVGRPAILLSFVPACLEIVGVLVLAPKLLGISLLEAAIVGAVIAAVSPAVVIPRMLKLMEDGYGTNKKIPVMVMAAASVDDVFVIVLFTAFTTLAQKGTLTPLYFLTIPTSIILGLAGGILVGFALSVLFSKVSLNDTAKIIIMLSVSFLLVALERRMVGVIGFSGLLAVMTLGAALRQRKIVLARNLSKKYAKLWIGAKVLLFALVGATVNLSYVRNAGMRPVLLIVCVLMFRMLGVSLSLYKTPLNKNERLFVSFAYMPKATVQAAIGGLPLAMGLACGDLVLTVAVLSIIITAPLGALLMDIFRSKLLTKKRANRSVRL